MTERPIVAVLGGGISGVVAAAELNQRGIAVDLIEKTSRLGGLHRSITIDDAVYDIGAFVFHTNHSLFRSFPAVADCCVPVTGTYRSLTPCGTLDDYPVTLAGYLRDNGVPHFCRACADIVLAKMRYASRNDLRAWVQYYLGASIYYRSGLKSYIERLYNIPDNEVDIEFARQRMSLIRDSASLRRILKRLLLRKAIVFDSDTERASELVRPHQGFDVLYGQIGDILRRRGVAILSSTAVDEVRPKDSAFEVIVNGESRRYSRIISTIPLETMAVLLRLPPFEKPEYMKLFSLFYRFRGKAGHDATVLYNFTRDGRWKRATMFSRYYGQHRGDDYFSVEGTVSGGEDESLDLFHDDFTKHVSENGLYRGRLNFQGGLITGHAYPLYRKGNTARVTQLKSMIRRAGIYTTGRQGELDYISSADAADNAASAATRVAASLT